MSISQIMIAVSAIFFVVFVFIFARWFEGLLHRNRAGDEINSWAGGITNKLELIIPAITLLVIVPLLLNQCSTWVEEEKQSQSE